MTNREISTDLLYEFLADPNKLKPIKQIAQIINEPDSDNNESFLVDFNNKNDNSQKINFNSDRADNKLLSSSSKQKMSSRLSLRNRSNSSSRLSLRNRSNSSPNNNFKEQIHNDIKNSIDNIISPDNNKIPQITKISLSPKNEENKQNNKTDTYDSIAYSKELKFRKMECFAKLIHLKNIGIELTKKYTMDSEIEEMEAELKYHSDAQSKKNGVQLAKSFMCNAITGMEFLNDKYDPFGFKLKGWSDQVKINKDDFDEVFGELLEKYKGNGKKIEPELKLMMMLMMSAGSFHMAQSMASNLPGLEDVIKNNPQLMAKLQSNINKSISGPSELDKKKELYENVKKLHEEKLKNKPNPSTQNKPNPSTQNKPNPSTQNKPTSVTKNESVQNNQNKPISVKNLLQDIKNSMPTNLIDSTSITIGDTIVSDSDTNKPSISASIKTKSRLSNRKNIQFSNT